MAEFIINTKSLTANYFYGAAGFNFYRVPAATGEPSRSNSFTVSEIELDDMDQPGLLGKLVFDNIVFESATWTEENEERQADGIKLYDAIVNISLNNEIVRTKVTGRKGTIKEFISNDDYNISIQALLVNTTRGKAPEVEVRAANRLLSAPVAIDVVSKFLEWMGIYQIAITNVKISTVPGFVNFKAIEIQALSNLPIDIETDLELKDA